LLKDPNPHSVSAGLADPGDRSPAPVLYKTLLLLRFNTTLPANTVSVGVEADLVKVMFGPVQSVAAFPNGDASKASAMVPMRKLLAAKASRVRLSISFCGMRPLERIWFPSI
jgi:hypothetical protein